MRQRLIDAKGVGAMLDRCTRTIARDDIAGRIPAPVWVGGSKRWRVQELERWIAAGCPLRAAWEARKSVQPSTAGQGDGHAGQAEQPKVTSAASISQEDPQVQQVPAVAVVVAPRERDLGDFRRFLAAGCTRAEWESRSNAIGNVDRATSG